MDNATFQRFNKLKSFLDEHIYSTTTTDKITVFPIQCGVGKSTYIKYLIADTLQHGNDGLIIVTDEIDRMKDYATSNDDCGIDLEYIQRLHDKIAILTNEDIAEGMRTQRSKPILLMTTQRYFNLTRDEIIPFTKHDKGIRNKIIKLG